MRFRALFFVITLVAAMLSGCSLTRHVPEGAYLYTGAELRLKPDDPETNTSKLEKDANALLENPRPNRRLLGIRWRLRLYNLFYTEKEKGLRAWLQRKLGEPPVLYDEQVARQTERLLEEVSANDGFFRAKTRRGLEAKGQKAKVIYEIALTQPYTIASYANQIGQSVVHQLAAASMEQSLIKPGMRYELSRLLSERERIARHLRGQGYYFFQDEFLKFRADTARSGRQVALALSVKPEVRSDQLEAQRLRQVFVYPDYEFAGAPGQRRDTSWHVDLTFVYDDLTVEPAVVREAILLRPDSLYSPEDHRNTLRRLALLPYFQFVDIQYERAAMADTLLDAYIYLTPRKKYTIEGTAGLSVRSSAYLGPEFSLGFVDRNFRERIEELRIETFGNFNIPLNEAFRSYQKVGLNGRLLRQGLNIPFRDRPLPEELVGQTRLQLDYTLEQVRLPMINFRDELEKLALDELLANLDVDSTYAPFARINRLDLSYAYQWTRRPDIRHDLTPLQITLQDARYQTDQLRTFLTNEDIFSSTRGSFLNLERMLIFKPSYVLTYDSRLRRLRRHNYFNRSRGALSGNILLTEGDLFTLRSIQTLFLQLENDWRYYYRVYDRQTFAFRFASSIAIPFRKGAVLPFIDLYNVGGANSVRAFPPRQLGPGSVEPTEETFFLASNGDLKLEGSVEWRQRLTSLFELALFVDAGNVWDLQRRADTNEQALFRWENFYRQIALGAGFGVRLDFEVLLLRLDLAIPLIIPWLPEGQRWVGDKINPGNPDWRRDNLNFSLAFGYPF